MAWRLRSYLLVGLAVVSVGSLIFIGAEPAFAFGELPLISEDPTSPCESYLDSDIGYALDLVGPGKDSLGQQEFRSHLDMSAPLVQLNYGITDRIAARVESEVPVTTVAPINGRLDAGFGDVTTGLKYRFMDQTGGLEYDDTCEPAQHETSYGLQGPVSISIFPQFSFPTGAADLGLGSGEYSLEIPVDVARKFGKLYIVGEGNFVWQFHDRTSPNGLQFGVAAYYSITDKLDLLGENRMDYLTAGRGSALWLMNIGAQYQLNDYFGLFAALGTGAAATSTVAPSYLSVIVGTDIILPINW